MDALSMLTLAQAAQALGCSMTTLRRHIANGEIGVVDIGTGSARLHARVEGSELDSFKARRRQRRLLVSPMSLSKDRLVPMQPSEMGIVARRAERMATRRSKGNVNDAVVRSELGQPHQKVLRVVLT
jgi:excisionase family DNA binding protein